MCRCRCEWVRHEWSSGPMRRCCARHLPVLGQWSVLSDSCVCFALDFDEQKRSGFRYQYSNYQIEYSRNLVFEVGGCMDQVFQALIDRSRAPMDLKTIKTILGYKRRPQYRVRNKTVG